MGGEEGRGFPAPGAVSLSYLLVVLDAHAECVDQDSNHDSTTKVLAVHNLPEGVTDQPPEGQYRVGLQVQPQAPLPSAVGVPEVTVLGILCELINCLAVGVRHLMAGELHLPGPSPGTVGAAVWATRSTVCLQARAGELARALAGTWDKRVEVRGSRIS